MRSEQGKTIISLAIATAVVGILIVPTKPAGATFPGQNGRISFLEFKDTIHLQALTKNATRGKS